MWVAQPVKGLGEVIFGSVSCQDDGLVIQYSAPCPVVLRAVTQPGKIMSCQLKTGWAIGVHLERSASSFEAAARKAYFEAVLDRDMV